MRFARWLLPVLICTGAVFFAGTVLADPPTGVPMANTDIPVLVPSALAQKIALRHAENTWGQVAPGPSFACADDDGDIVAYAFTFAIGKTLFPSSEELSSYLRYGRDVAERGFEAMSESDQRDLLAEIAAQSLVAQTGAGKTGLEQRQNLMYPYDPEAVNDPARQFGRRKMIGAGDFGTVVVSARYDRFPIPYYSDYLPPYLYKGDVAEQEAAKALSAEQVSLDRVYFIEREGMYFEFSSANGSVLMHSGTLEVLPPETVLARKGKKVFPVPETRARIDAQWDLKKREVGE